MTQSPENSNYADPYLESSSSELSDILEVEEDLIGEETNQKADILGHSPSLVAPFPQATNQVSFAITSEISSLKNLDHVHVF